MTQEFKLKDKDVVVFDSFGLQGEGIVKGYSMMGVNPMVIVEVTRTFSQNGTTLPSEVYPFTTIGAFEHSVHLRDPGTT